MKVTPGFALRATGSMATQIAAASRCVVTALAHQQAQYGRAVGESTAGCWYVQQYARSVPRAPL